MLWRPVCGFWKRMKNENSYWKIVFCREVKSRKNKTKLQYEDVPTEIPYKKEEVEKEDENDKEGVSNMFENPDLVQASQLEEKESDVKEESHRPINRIPTVYKPRGYPFVKRNQEDATLDTSFEYFMNSSHRDSFNSGRNLYSDDNSIYTITTETNDSVSEAYSISEEENNSSEQESKLRTIGRSFMKKIALEKNKSQRSDKQKSSNNNTVQHFYTINELKADETDELSISPSPNDIIFMDKRTCSISSKNDLWKVNTITQKIDDDNSNFKMKSRTSSYVKDDRESKKLYGLSTTIQPFTVSSSAPAPQTLKDQETTQFGLIEKDRKTNIFYSPV